jgi:hypothetical protein
MASTHARLSRFVANAAAVPRLLAFAEHARTHNAKGRAVDLPTMGLWPCVHEGRSIDPRNRIGRGAGGSDRAGRRRGSR